MKQHKWEEDGSICTVIEEDSGTIRFFGKAFHGSMPSGDESLLAREMFRLVERIGEQEARERIAIETIAASREAQRRLEGQVAELVRQLREGLNLVTGEERARQTRDDILEKCALAQRAMMYR